MMKCLSLSTFLLCWSKGSWVQKKKSSLISYSSFFLELNTYQPVYSKIRGKKQYFTKETICTKEQQLYILTEDQTVYLGFLRANLGMNIVLAF